MVKKSGVSLRKLRDTRIPIRVSNNKNNNNNKTDNKVST